MPSERLLKRIRYWGKDQGERVSRLEVGDYKNSVLADLALLYNTNKGTVLVSGDMGVPDFTSLMNSFGPQEVATIEQAFVDVTDKYEPRITNVVVKYQPRGNEFGVLRFSVSGILAYKNQELPMEFSALVQGNGSVTVEV